MFQQLFARRAAAVLTGVLVLGAACAPSLAATKKEKKSSAQPTKSVKFIPGSQETTKERTTRLKRECKGRVNAGACEGHTQ
jgi:hypothetical protein